MALMQWNCECGESNRLKNPQCVKCGNDIPKKYLHKIFIEEYEEITKQLQEEDRRRLLKRIKKEQQLFVYLMAPINIALWVIITVFVFYNVNISGWGTAQNNWIYANNSINPIRGFGSIYNSFIEDAGYMWNNVKSVAVGEYENATQNGGAADEYGETMKGRFGTFGSNVEKIKCNVVDTVTFITDKIDNIN